MSHVLTLEVPEAVHDSLAKKAKHSGQSTEALAIELLIAAAQEYPDDPLEEFIGAFDSDGGDWANRHDQHIGRAAIETLDDESDDSRSDG